MEANRAGPFGQQRIPQPTKERHAEKKRNKYKNQIELFSCVTFFKVADIQILFFFLGFLFDYFTAYVQQQQN